MIKLLLLIPTLDRSGAEKQLTLLASGLPRDQFEVHVAALTRGGPYQAELQRAGVPVTILNKRGKFDPVAYWRLRRLLSALQPDILHTWLFAASAYGRMALPRGSRTKVIVSERCVDTWKSGWQFWIDRRLQSSTARLVANSQSVADFYRQRGFPSDRIAVIPNAVPVLQNSKGQGREGNGAEDSSHNPPPPAPSDSAHAVEPAYQRERPAADLLAELDIPPGARLVGFAGRLARQKRVDDLLWAMQLLRQLVQNVYFLVIGEGPERLRLQQLARQLTCADVTRFTGMREDAADLIGLLDVFWLASDFEGMSNSLMEAMAAGVPVVASDIPPNRELVVDGQTGFLVKVGDSVGFAQFTDRILADRELACRLGRAGRRRMQEEFSVERMVSAHAALYRQLASPGK